MKKILFIPLYLLSLMLFVVSACKKEEGIITPANLVSDPAEALPGAYITITGTNLQDIVSIKFGSADASFSSIYNTSTAILTTVPTGASYGAQKITLVNRSGGTAQLDFVVKQPYPVISSFNPASGPVGDTITLTGTYLRNIKSLLIGNTEAKVVDSTSATSIKFVIPTGASSGLITIVTSGGSSISSSALTVGERALLIADFDGAGVRPNGSSWYSYGDMTSKTIENASPAPVSGFYLKAIPKTTSTSGYAGFETYDLSSGTQSFGLTSSATSTFLKFEANNNGKTATVLQVVLYDGTNNFAKNVSINGTGWNTVSIKLSDMLSGYGSGTLTPTPSAIQKVKFLFQGYSASAMEANIDNVRIVY